MTSKEEYAARIPDVAERENAARLYDHMRALEEAADAAENKAAFAPASDEMLAARNALSDEYHKRYKELMAWYDAEVERIDPEHQAPERAAAEAAERAYNDAPGNPIAEDDDGRALRCALSGVPIYDTDETVDLGGKTILAAVLLSPEEIAALTADDDEEESLDEAA